MTHKRVGICIAVMIGAGICAPVPATAAQICSARKVTATGAPSSLAFFARSRARTAWIAKVTKEPRLGPTNAQWLRARERRVVCRKVDTQTLCIAAALPCRNILTFPQPPPQATPIVAKLKPVRPL